MTSVTEIKNDEKIKAVTSIIVILYGSKRIKIISIFYSNVSVKYDIITAFILLLEKGITNFIEEGIRMLMEKRISIHKLIVFFLVTFLVWGLLVPITPVLAEGNGVTGNVKKFTVRNADGSVEEGGYIANQIFRLNYEWEASNNGHPLHEGDYFEMDLPDKFKFPTESNYCKFDLYAANGTDVVAKVVITPNNSGGGKMKVTFTSFVNGKHIISGELHLTARWNQDVYPITAPTEHDIVVGSITETVKIRPYIPPNYATEVIYKTSG